MTKTITRGVLVGTALAAALVVAPAAQASTVAGDVTASETQTFHASDYGSDKKRAINNAHEAARRHAAIAGFIPGSQCVLTHSDSSRISVGFWHATVVISCTRP
ncbi:hypothetical protein [Allokutzneria oryzae]|uniref:Secreted protein n=1 Tax=Allokutzneria oryzae TaxID=1378989 RepID=A0ABV5ZV55_9PSEU